MQYNIILKYKIVKKIGNGSFGDVYRGQNINTNNLVAIKSEIKNKDDDNTIKRITMLIMSI